MKAFTSTRELARFVNDETSNHWFEPATMRAFHSRYSNTLHLSEVLPDSVVAYFVSSEQFEDARTGHKEPRKYTVRQVVVRWDGLAYTADTETVGEYQAYSTLAEAQRAAKAEAAR